MVDTLEQFIEVIKKPGSTQMVSINMSGIEEAKFDKQIDEKFCPYCGAIRKCEINNCTEDNSFRIFPDRRIKFTGKLPYVFKTRCLQCEHEAVLVIYKGAEQTEMAVLHDTYGGCVTPNTPNEVKYYIDQAFRTRSVGAMSAAMTMYRSALEWILYDQGYKNGMLGKKIGELQNDIVAGKAPKWAQEINTDFLEAIKEIGNGAIHTNDGDISKQKEIDKGLIEIVDIVFAELLDKIYEQPIRSAENLNKLQQVVCKIKN